ADEDVFHHPGLGVGAVEDGDVGGVVALVDEGVDLVGDESGFVVLVLGFVADDGLAFAFVGPQVLGGAARVVGDDGVGGLEDRLGRAVVLVEDHEIGRAHV